MNAPRVAVLAMLAALLVSGPARAEGDAALARDLSKQGYELLLANRCAEAIPILERSHKLGPDPRTLVNLARCEDRLLKLGRALEHLTTARDLARDRHLTEMTTQLELMIPALEKRLARVIVTIEPNAPAGTVVQRASVELPASTLQAGVPVDPGDQTFEAVAPGHAPKVFHVTAVEGESYTLTVTPGPKLPPAPPPRVDTPPRSASSPPSILRPVGLVGMAMGGAAIGTGAVFGILAIDGKSDADSAGCVGAICPDTSSARSRDDAKVNGTVSTVLIAAGGVLAIGGLVLFLVAPAKAERVARIMWRGWEL